MHNRNLFSTASIVLCSLLRTSLVPAACLKHAVSVVHQCDSRCGWLEKDQPTQVERELISVNTTGTITNIASIYCMSNAL